MTASLHREGSVNLSDANLAFLAQCCARYRETHGLTMAEAAARAGVSATTWSNAEHQDDLAGQFKVDGTIANIVSLVLRVSPICAKGESQHNRPPKLGVAAK